MTSGRKPKPTWLKLVTGNPGRRPINEAEPQLAGDLIETPPPALASDAQREVWTRVMTDAPYLCNADRDMLVAYCVAVAAFQEAVTKVNAFGQVIKQPHTGNAVKSPFYRNMVELARLQKELGSELGLSPASRSRVAVAKANPAAQAPNAFADLKELPD